MARRLHAVRPSRGQFPATPIVEVDAGILPYLDPARPLTALLSEAILTVEQALKRGITDRSELGIALCRSLSLPPAATAHFHIRPTRQRW